VEEGAGDRIEFGADHGLVTATGTAIEIETGEQEDPLRGGLALGGRGRVDVQKLPDPAECIGFDTVGQEAEVANAHEATWEYVQEETADELVGGKRRGASYVTVGAVAIGEADGAVLEIEDALVADRGAVRVAAEIVQDLLGTGEGLLGVDDPGLAAQRRQASVEIVAG
jgi:hypothetical protein